MHRNPFEAEIAEDRAQLIGPWRNPRQMLAEQVYDNHVSIHDDATAKRLGFNIANPPANYEMGKPYRLRSTRCSRDRQRVKAKFSNRMENGIVTF